jgi:hypothetical protein
MPVVIGDGNKENATKGEFQSLGDYTTEVGLRLGMGVA